MREQSLDCDAIAKIREYLKYPIQGLFFVAFDDPEDLDLLMGETSSCRRLKLSAFCKGDSTPDFSAFFAEIADFGNAPDAKGLFLLGVGEYVALTGDETPLARLEALHREPRRQTIVAPVWNGCEFLDKLAARSPFSFEKTALCLRRSGKTWRYKNFLAGDKNDYPDFSGLLAKLEQGYAGEIKTATRVGLKPEWGSNIESNYGLFCAANPQLHLAEQLFNDQQWGSLAAGAYLDRSFFGSGTFFDLKTKPPANAYLARVAAQTKSHAEFRERFVSCFLEMEPDDPDFKQLVEARRELSPKLDPLDLSDFIERLRARRAGPAKLPYLTDASTLEKFEIIRCVRDEIPPGLEACFPDLCDYLDDYDFCGSENVSLYAEIGKYFCEYKLAKLKNEIPAALEQKVATAARDKTFMLAPTRGSLLDNKDDGETMLYWLDALGCEYLGFIRRMAIANRLAVSVGIGRAELPSITSENRDFFDNWRGKKRDSKKLDAIKHDLPDGISSSEAREYPLHLALELEVVREVVEEIAAVLNRGDARRVILASDHGATRLAVISGREEAWEMPEPGKHGGRCCKIADAGAFKPAAAIGDGRGKWYSLGDYSRFRGGRAGSVEVHGGATLEEVLVPVVVFFLADSKPVIGLKGQTDFKPNFGDKKIVLTIHSSRPLVNPRLHLGEQFLPMRPGRETGDYAVDISLELTQAQNDVAVYEDSARLEPVLRFKVAKGGVREKDFGFDDF